VREDGRLVGGKEWKERVCNREKLKKAPENDKESSHSENANGMKKVFVN
jgi:hypothetical protein